jgi:hypothetical protein
MLQPGIFKAWGCVARKNLRARRLDSRADFWQDRWSVIKFLPYSLAVAVALELLSDLLSCDQTEQLPAMMRESGLTNHQPGVPQ